MPRASENEKSFRLRQGESHIHVLRTTKAEKHALHGGH